MTSPVSVPAAARWGTIGQLGGQACRLVVLIVLAKLLEDWQFGYLEWALYVIGLIEVIKAVGTTEFLIKEKSLTPLLTSSVFFVNVAIGCSISALLWFAEPIYGKWFASPDVGPLIAGLGLSFAILSIGNVHEAMLRRALEFKRLAIVLFAGPVAYAAAAIPAALAGWAERAFVAGALAEAITMSTSLWVVCRWRPKVQFAWSEARKTFRFSVFLTFAEIVRYAAEMSDRLLVGIFFGDNLLGAYGLARRILMQAAKPIVLVFHKVILPALSMVQGDAALVRERYLRACATVALITFPIMGGTFALAEPFFTWIDPEKWGPSIPLMRIFAPAMALQTVASTVGVLYLLHNRAGWLFIWSVLSGMAFVAGYSTGAWIGSAEAMAWCTVGSMLLLLWPAFAIPFRFVGLRVADVFVRIRMAAVMTLVMTAVVWASARVLQSVASPFVVMLTCVPIGVAIYLLLIRVLRPPGTDDLLGVVPGRFAR